MFTIRVNAISRVTPQRTFPNRSDEPTPTIAELTTCVVLTGAPVRGRRHDHNGRRQLYCETVNMPYFKNLLPRVRINLQPPIAVPIASAAAVEVITHNGTAKSSVMSRGVFKARHDDFS
jgi:hypothetical protein